MIERIQYIQGLNKNREDHSNTRLEEVAGEYKSVEQMGDRLRFLVLMHKKTNKDSYLDKIAASLHEIKEKDADALSDLRNILLEISGD
jgi:O-phosphoseryl-tRNA(Cys) synthetase